MLFIISNPWLHFIFTSNRLIRIIIQGSHTNGQLCSINFVCNQMKVQLLSFSLLTHLRWKQKIHFLMIWLSLLNHHSRKSNKVTNWPKGTKPLSEVELVFYSHLERLRRQLMKEKPMEESFKNITTFFRSACAPFLPITKCLNIHFQTKYETKFTATALRKHLSRLHTTRKYQVRSCITRYKYLPFYNQIDEYIGKNKFDMIKLYGRFSYCNNCIFHF